MERRRVERAKLDRKGRLTIPAAYREKLDLGEEVARTSLRFFSRRTQLPESSPPPPEPSHPIEPPKFLNLPEA